MPKDKKNTKPNAHVSSVQNFNDSENKDTNDKAEMEAKVEALDVFFDVLKALLNRELGENPHQSEIKHAVYIAKYIQGILANCLLYWRDHGRLPVITYSIFGNDKGRSIVDMYMTPDAQIFEGFKLRSLAIKLKEATDEWDLELDQSDVQLPTLTEMADIQIETLQAYTIVQGIIKSQSEGSEGSENE